MKKCSVENRYSENERRASKPVASIATLEKPLVGPSTFKNLIATSVATVATSENLLKPLQNPYNRPNGGLQRMQWMQSRMQSDNNRDRETSKGKNRRMQRMQCNIKSITRRGK